MSAEVVVNVRGQASTGDIDKLVASLEAMAAKVSAALDKVAPSAGAAADSVAKVADSAAAAGDKGVPAVSGLSGALGKLGPYATAAAAAIAGIGAAITGVTAAALVMGKDASAAYATIANETGLTGKALDDIESSARRVAAGVSASFGDVASVMGQLSTRTGQTGPELESLTKQMMQLASVTGSDVNALIPLTTRMFGDWGVAVDQQAGKLDLLFRASQQTGVGVDELSRLVVQFGAPLRNFGFSIEEGVTLLGKWQQAGVNTELVMGSLRIASGKFADEGIDLRAGLEGAIKAIKEAGSSSEATAIAMDIFGARAGADMADTIRGGKFEIDAWVDAVKNGESTIKGAASEAAGLSGAFKAIGGAMSVAVSPITDLVFDLATTIVRQVVPAVAEFAAAIGDRLAPIADSARAALMPLIQTIGPILTLVMKEFTGSFADAGTGVKGFFDSLQGSAVIEGLRSAIVGAGAALLGLIDIGKALGGWFSENYETIKTFAVVLGATLVGAVIALAVALATTLLPSLTASAIAAWATVAPILATAAAALAAAAPFVALGAVVGVLAGLIYVYWDQIKAKTAEVWAWIQNATSELGASLSSTWAWLSETISTTVTELTTWLTGAWSSFIGWFRAKKSAMVSAIVAAWTWAKVTVSAAVASLINWLSNAWHTFIGWIAGAINRAVSIVAAAWAWLSGAVSGAVKPLLEWLGNAWAKAGSYIGGVLQKLGEMVGKAWRWIVDTIVKAANTVLDGIWSFMSKFVDAFRRGFTAAGGIVERIMGGIAKMINNLANALGPAGKFLADMATSIKSGISGLVDGASGGLDKIGDKLGGAIGKVTAKFSEYKQKITETFSGLSLGGLAQPGAGGGPGGGDTGPGLADISGLGGGGGAGGGGPQDKEVGGQYHDAMGDYTIGEDGQKIYTSGPGLAKQQAAERAREAKRAKSGASAAAARTRGQTAAALAKETADIAKKVAEAIRAGLDAIKDLTDGELPSEALWQPRLDALTSFASAALSRFQEAGAKLMDRIGTDEEGAGVFDTAKVQMAEAAANLTGIVVDAVTKAGAFLQGLVKAKFPTDAQVDAAMTQIEAVMTRVRDGAVRLGGPLGDEAATARLAGAGGAVAAWVDAYLKVAAGAKSITEAPPIGEGALASIEGALSRVSTMMRAFTVGPGYDLLKDADQTSADLAVVRDVAETLGAGVSLVAGVATVSRDVARTADVPESALDSVRSTLSRVSAILGGLVRGPGYDLLRDRDRTAADLLVARDMVGTMDLAVGMVANLAAASRTIARVADVPASATERVQSALSRVAAMLGSLLVGPGYNLLRDTETTTAHLGVTRIMVDTMVAAVDLIVRLTDSAKAIIKAPPVGAAAVGAVQSTMQSIAAMLGALVVGEGYNLLRDGERTTRDLAVVRELLATLAAGIDAIGRVIALDMSKASTIGSDALAIVGGNILALVDEIQYQANLWVDATGLLSPLLDNVKAFADIVGTVVKVAADVAGMSVNWGKVSKVPADALAIVGANILKLVDEIQYQAGLWTSADGPLSSLLTNVKAFSEVVAGAVAATVGAAGMTVRWAEVTAIPARALAQVGRNIDDIVAATVYIAGLWAHATGALVPQLAPIKAFSEVVAAAFDIVATAAVDTTAWASVTAIPARALVIIGQRVDDILAAVVYMASLWSHATGELMDVLARVKEFADIAKSAVDLIATVGGLTIDWSKATSITQSALSVIAGNVQVIVAKMVEIARGWLVGTGELDPILAKTEAFANMADASISTIAKTLDVLNKFAVQGSNIADIRVAMPRIRDNVVLMIQGLAEVYNTVEAEAGTLAKADNLQKVLGPAAEAVAKVLGVLNLDALIKNPLVDTKLRSGFMGAVAARRMQALADQIAAGIKRTVQVLIDGLAGVTVPEGLDVGMDKLAAVYERILGVLEKIRDVALPDPAKVRQLVDELRQLTGAAGGAGGGGGGGTGDRVPLGVTTRTGGADSGGEYRRPAGTGTGGERGDARPVSIMSPVYLDGEQIGRAFERILTTRGLQIVALPQGG